MDRRQNKRLPAKAKQLTPAAAPFSMGYIQATYTASFQIPELYE